MAASPGKFIWHELVTPDPKAAIDFYGHVLGLKPVAMPMMTGGTYYRWEANGVGMGGLYTVTKRQQDEGMKAGWVGYLTCPDVDAGVKRVKALGGMVQRPPEDIGAGTLAPVSDAQAAGFILFKPQPLPGEVPRKAVGTGTVVWNELLTTDAKAAFAFYSEMFGWKKERETQTPDGPYLVCRTGDEASTAIVARPGVPPHWVFYFSVERIDPALERVKAKGGETLEHPVQVPTGDWIARVQDGQGGIFALMSPAR